MTKKNDKRLCWNCDGSISLHFTQCPYCGVDQTTTTSSEEDHSPFKSFSSNSTIPNPPFAAAFSQNGTINEEEWNQALGEKAEALEPEEEISTSSKKEMIALLLLLPGVAFLLFGVMLTLFSTEGALILEWDQSFAYLYFLGALPLLFLGWRALK